MNHNHLKTILAAIALIVAILLVILLPTTARAAELTYVGEIEFSAYWPHEDQYNNNHRGQPLTDLVGDIVACPTGSDLLGKEIIIYCPSLNTLMRRRVWDTGCKPGRLDLLVGGPGEMRAWGLRDCYVWAIEGAGGKAIRQANR